VHGDHQQVLAVGAVAAHGPRFVGVKVDVPRQIHLTGREGVRQQLS